MSPRLSMVLAFLNKYSCHECTSCHMQKLMMHDQLFRGRQLEHHTSMVVQPVIQEPSMLEAVLGI